MSDYLAFLEEMALTPAQMQSALESMPEPRARVFGEPYRVGDSPINGKGCFATHDVDGDVCKLHDGSQWFEAGRYINHSEKPNARVVRDGECLVAVGKAAKDEEITLDYRHVVAAMKRVS